MSSNKHPWSGMGLVSRAYHEYINGFTVDEEFDDVYTDLIDNFKGVILSSDDVNHRVRRWSKPKASWLASEDVSLFDKIEAYR